MPDIKEKPKADGKIKEKIKAAPKELARRGLSSGVDRLLDQFRDSGRQDQNEDMGQTRLEDGVHQGARYAEQGGRKLLQKAKKGMTQRGNGSSGKTSPDSRSAPAGSTAPASTSTADMSRTAHGFAPITEDTAPRIKTREAYFGRQAVSAAASGEFLQDSQPIAYQQGREHAVKRAVRERRDGSGKMSQSQAPSPSAVSTEKAPCSSTPSAGAEERGRDRVIRRAARDRGASLAEPTARRPVSGSGGVSEPASIKGRMTARRSAAVNTPSGGRAVGRNTQQAVSRGAKQAVKGRKQSVSVSRATAQTAQAAARKVHAVRQLTGNADRSRQAAKAAGRGIRTAVQAAARTLRAIAAAARGLLAALAAGGSVCVSIVVILCLVGLLAASPFGILFAGESGGADTVPVSAAVAQVNYDLNARLENLQAGNFDTIKIVGQPPAWEDVLAVFAVYVAGGDAAVDVAAMDADRVARLKAVFWDMTTLSSDTTTVDHPDTDPSDAVDDSCSETTLTITISARTAAEMAAVFGFDLEQMDVLDELLSQRELLAELAGETESVNSEARELLRALPEELSPERKAVVRAACSLVGKVNYYWGGKSLVIGWDSRWGMLQKVTADGSPSTGTYRPYGLDCSGMVDWVFYNITGGDYIMGHGGGASAQHSCCTDITWEEARPGDLVFYPGDSHVGIVGGWDENGDILVIHCASGYNNVAITGPEGFTSVARPVYYPE